MIGQSLVKPDMVIQYLHPDNFSDIGGSPLHFSYEYFRQLLSDVTTSMIIPGKRMAQLNRESTGRLTLTQANSALGFVESVLNSDLTGRPRFFVVDDGSLQGESSDALARVENLACHPNLDTLLMILSGHQPINLPRFPVQVALGGKWYERVQVGDPSKLTPSLLVMVADRIMGR